LRWWIGSLLLVSTVINFIDGQTLSLLALYLKLEYHWTNHLDARQNRVREAAVTAQQRS